ncbi:hypothetical protein SDC9_96596 [bioreactor metagenome]|uniref:Glycosyltransferase subfamily 4-like N-terminal domain-containing protein n=1 Tax=bioreactor metagenome TaxID=1076179 RepID=A0A645AGA7_9ZZZZ
MKLPTFNFDNYIFVVTGMSYIIDSSGTSKVVKAHEDIFVEAGIGYVAIFPISRSSGEGVNWHVRTTGCYAFVINGQFRRVMTAKDVLNSLLELQKTGKNCIGILIHHIIRNDIAEVKWILEKIQNVPVVYYLHDFYTCCINPNMLKNDTESCVDGNVSCEGCAYAEKRAVHLKVIEDFVSKFQDRITFVAPSDYTRNRWLTYHPQYEDRSLVILHQKCIGEYLGNKEPIPEDQPLRLGFVGTQTHVKGWDIFKKVVAATQKAGCNYEYYYFGHGKEQIPSVKNIPVEIAKQGKDAMIKAIQEKRISAVFLVCVWGETYSYMMFESHAANSYIFTMRQSGNIAYTVEYEKWGRVFDSEEDIIQALCDEKMIRADINKWKLESAPGAKEYADNNDIVTIFSADSNGKIIWKRSNNSIIHFAKAAALNIIFKRTRLKN